MKTYILMWNPAFSSYTKERFENDLIELNTLEYAEGVGNWSVWEHEKAEDGDRFFMVRVGKGNTGIVMAGTFGSNPYQDEDWSGKNRPTFYMDLLIDVQVDSDYVPVLSTAILTEKLPGFDWTGGHSGRLLDQESAERLEALWEEYYDHLLTIEDPKHVYISNYL